MTTECIILKCLNINPIHSNISLYVLLTVLYTFSKVLTRRIYVSEVISYGEI